ncbi:hypothetical protein [Luteitalea sp.]
MTHETSLPGRPSPVDPVALHADALLRDRRLNWLRPRRRRRVLVGVALVSIAGVATACLIDRAWLVAVSLASAWGAWWLLQRVVRGMADLPDAYVDERMRQVRNAHYRTAYALLSGVTVLPLLVLYMAADAGRVQFVPQSRHLLALFWGVQLLALTLPSILVAWNEPEV